jgi:hypothetical protein
MFRATTFVDNCPKAVTSPNTSEIRYAMRVIVMVSLTPTTRDSRILL